MQHKILKHGFTYCGIIYLLSGDAHPFPSLLAYP